MLPPANLIQILEFKETGFSSLVDYGSWRVALLNFTERLLPENIETMQRHDATDEVFVLLRGECILFIGEGDDHAIQHIHACRMEPLKLYNVKRATWHTHTLARGTSVLIVENKNTTIQNSPTLHLSEHQRISIQDLAANTF